MRSIIPALFLPLISTLLCILGGKSRLFHSAVTLCFPLPLHENPLETSEFIHSFPFSCFLSAMTGAPFLFLLSVVLSKYLFLFFCVFEHIKGKVLQLLSRVSSSEK